MTKGTTIIADGGQQEIFYLTSEEYMSMICVSIDSKTYHRADFAVESMAEKV